ncbi:MAG: PAS domain S-box protein [Rhodoferax sp.]|uniref:PAS domain-containing sensor histidine kinase n=1 Tax=Rhodoferax sp. TaxID=50421 RepID=UPI001B4121EA|nr:PAS domain S-box protein [Rhodoferax sp.]
MTPSDQNPDDTVLLVSTLQQLRRRAMDRQREVPRVPPQLAEGMTPEDVQLLFHELRVHQVELELQNEELRSAQVALEIARERYFDLYDMAPVGYCTITDQDLILEANLTVATLLGVPRGSLVKRALTSFMPHAQRAIYRQSTEQLRATGEPQSFELQMTRSDSSKIWVSLVANVSRSLSGSSVLRVMLKDVSERKQLDAILHEKNLELERTRQLADKANRAKSDFLASMSHELRSPLNAILGFAQLMDAGTPPPTPAQKSSIDQIVHGGWYLLALVNEILDLAGIESGQLALTMGDESLAEVLADCQTMIEPQANASGIELAFPGFDQPCRVQADRRRLKQVLINLLSNAIKYNRAQGRVAVSWSLRPHGRVRVSVQDSGTGLSTEQLAQLFQPFNRLGQENGPHEGTGIGLTVSKRLVEMMGGTIGASSTPAVGSNFWFELSLATAPAAI